MFSHSFELSNIEWKSIFESSVYKQDLEHWSSLRLVRQKKGGGGMPEFSLKRKNKEREEINLK